MRQRSLQYLAFCLSLFGFFSLTLLSAASETKKNLPASDPVVAAPPTKDPVIEAMRQDFFGSDIQKPVCKTIETGPSANAQNLNPALKKFIQEILDSLRKSDSDKFLAMLHARFGFKKNKIDELFAGLKQTYGAPLDFSIYKAWALNAVNEVSEAIPCGDEVGLYPIYGHPLQIGLWVQILGQSELGRIFMIIISKKDGPQKDSPQTTDWVVSALQTQQWTHHSMDAFQWAKQADANLAAGLKPAAYIKYDIALKLLRGGEGVLHFPAIESIEKAKNNALSQADFEAVVTKHIKKYEPAYIGTLLTIDGAGVLVRMKTLADLSLNEVRATCNGLAESISATTWGKVLTGVKCTFVLPKEDPKQDGLLGGLYVAFAKPENAKVPKK